MIIKRLITQIRFWLYMGNGYKRAEYAKRNGLFGAIGENCKLPVYLPLYPKLVRLHNHVVMHRSVQLVTHDMLNSFLTKIPNSYQYKHKEILSPIEIMDDVYIGMNSIVLGNVKIGPNVIINAGSVVVSDIPPNSIVAGVPAKVVGKFDIYTKTRILKDKSVNFAFKRSGAEQIDNEAIEKAWELFDRKKNRERTTIKRKDN